MKNEKGFTLIELMVVVAMVGILSAVAYPNFQRYRAKSRTIEAKLQLSKVYTAQSSFFSDFAMYSFCLRYMGYDPSEERNQRFYAMYHDQAVTIDATAFAKAVNVGLNSTSCPAYNVGVAGDGNTNAAANIFFAGQGIGPTKADESYAFAVTWTAGDCTNSTNVTGDSPCLGTQATEATMSFQYNALGVIYADKTTSAVASKYNIDNNKIIQEITPGY